MPWLRLISIWNLIFVPAVFPNVEGGFQAMISLLTLPESKRPTALLAYNDLIESAL
jgi:DNA-binding LacI/PurR family transcriptional regulator